MITARTKIRPRLRSAEMSLIGTATLASAEPTATRAIPDDAMPPLLVLARLPEVAVSPDRAKLSLRLDWLKRLDWQQIRRVKVDPNWVAGGVLGLVLLLLLVITFNRGAKPTVEAPSQQEAPAWNSAGNVPPATSGASANAPTTVLGASPNNAASNSAGSGQRIAQEGQPVAPGHSGQASASVDSSLTGIYYFQTPHRPFTPELSNFASANQLNRPGFGEEIRTAHRNVIAPSQPSAPVGSQQPAQAHLQGRIITNPVE